MGKRNHELYIVLKAELMDSIAKKSGHMKKTCKEVYGALIEVMIDKFMEGKAIYISDIGNFEVRTIAAKETLNPKTNKPMYISERKTVRFKPAKRAKKAANGVE